MKRNLYTSFVRSCLEYGIQLIVDKGCIGILESFQKNAFHVMTGAPRNVSTAALYRFLALPTMHTRAAMLQARFVKRRGWADANMMLFHAMADSQVMAVWGKILGYEASNPVLQHVIKLCEERGLVNPSSVDKDRLLNEALEWVQIEELQAWSKITRQVVCFGPVESTSAEKRIVRSRSRAELSLNARRLLNRHLMRRVGFGTPETCTFCNEHRVTVYHIAECFGVDIDYLCRISRWNEASIAIMSMIAECAPRNFLPLAEVVVRRRPPDILLPGAKRPRIL